MFCLISFLNEICVISGDKPRIYIKKSHEPVQQSSLQKSRTQLYSCRWEIEVFHYVLKSGCTVEELQLKEDDRIKPAVALYMVIAWRVMYAMKLGRECPNLPCDLIFETDEWKALWVIAYDYQALEKKPSLGEFILKVAEFGGYLGRKSDGPPGPKSIWIGMTRVRDFTLAWKHFQEKHPYPK